MTNPNPTPSTLGGEGQSQSRQDRSPSDFAIEFGGYLATAAEQFLDKLNEHSAFADLADSGETAALEELNDYRRGLRSAIYEFTKRAERAALLPDQPPVRPGDREMVEGLRAKLEKAAVRDWRVSSFEPNAGGRDRCIMGGDGFGIAWLCGRSAEEHDALASLIIETINNLPRLLDLSSRPDEGRSVPEGWRPTHRHLKRGTAYQVVGIAALQDASGLGVREGMGLMIYRDEGGALWAREAGEFNDGRFEPLPAAPNPPPYETGGEG